MDKPYKSFVKDNITTIIGHILVYAQSIVLIPIIIKTVGASTYGGYILVMSVMGFIFGISSFGIGYRYKRFLPSAGNSKARQDLYYPQVYFQVISLSLLSILLVLVLPHLKTLFFKEIGFSVLVFPLLFFATLFYSQTTDYFRYTGRMAYYNYSTVPVPSLYIGMVLILVYSLSHDLSINLLVLLQCLAMIVITTPFFLKMLREIGFRRPSWNVQELREDMRIGFPLLLVFVVDFILNVSDRYVISLYLSESYVGYYATAYTVGSLMIFFPKVSGVVLPPLLSRYVDKSRHEESRVMVNYTIKIFLLISIPFAAGSIVLSRPVLTLLANTEVADNAMFVTPVVALGALFYGLNLILNNVLFVRMKTSVMFRASVLAAAVNLLLNLVLLYFIRDILIAGITTLSCYVIVFVFMYHAVSRDWPLDFSRKAIVQSVMASMIMGMMIFLIRSISGIEINQPFYLLAEVLIGFLVYAALLLAFGTFSKKELSYLKGILLSRQKEGVSL